MATALRVAITFMCSQQGGSETQQFACCADLFDEIRRTGYSVIVQFPMRAECRRPTDTPVESAAKAHGCVLSEAKTPDICARAHAGARVHIIQSDYTKPCANVRVGAWVRACVGGYNSLMNTYCQ